jgi:hypothetical protein
MFDPVRGMRVSPDSMPAFQHEGTKASIALRPSRWIVGLEAVLCSRHSNPEGYEDMGSVSEVHVMRRLKMGAS